MEVGDRAHVGRAPWRAIHGARPRARRDLSGSAARHPGHLRRGDPFDPRERPCRRASAPKARHGGHGTRGSCPRDTDRLVWCDGGGDHHVAAGRLRTEPTRHGPTSSDCPTPSAPSWAVSGSARRRSPRLTSRRRRKSPRPRSSTPTRPDGSWATSMRASRSWSRLRKTSFGSQSEHGCRFLERVWDGSRDASTTRPFRPRRHHRRLPRAHARANGPFAARALTSARRGPNWTLAAISFNPSCELVWRALR